MTLTQLVSYFRKGGSFEAFCQTNKLNPESEVIEVYMVQPFDLSKEVAFFEIEETEGKVEHAVNEVTYHNLFDFYYFLDAIAESNEGEHLSKTDDDVARAVLSYATHDA